MRSLSGRKFGAKRCHIPFLPTQIFKTTASVNKRRTSSASASSTTARIRLVSINDVYDIAKNLPRLQTFLSRLSPKPSAVLLCGDFLSPSTLSSIDCGRGMVATLRTVGITHVSLGNHEQDLSLNSLRLRLEDLSAPVTASSSSSPVIQIINSNMQHNLPSSATWVSLVTQPYSIIASPCGKVKVALLGLLSDEPGIFRDNTFKSIPIQNVLESYSERYQELTTTNCQSDAPKADFVIPMTHESMVRDKELAKHMLSLHGGPGLILGGHEHEPLEVHVTLKEASDSDAPPKDDNGICILKSGMDADAARVVDLTFEIDGSNTIPHLVEIQDELVEMKDYEPSPLAQSVVDKHLSVIKELENEVIVDANAVVPMLPIDFVLSSERARYQQTTVGSLFCQMIKEQYEGKCDVALLNGAPIKGDRKYSNNKMSYAELKAELPFPTKIVTVSMQSNEVYEAIKYSRTSREDGTDENAKEIPRRGYLQVDYDLEQRGWEDLGYSDETLIVALPRNLLSGFCKIKPLMKVGDRLKEQGCFPGPDDYVQAIDLVVRHACKNRWYQLVGDKPFNYFDLNGDGVLDRKEIKMAMQEILGYEPSDFVVDDMISAIDHDDNGVIDQGEFSYLLAQIEREQERF